MSTLRITAKGQVTLKKDVLNALGVRPGDEVEVEVLGEHRVLLRPARTPTPVMDAFGLLRQFAPAQPVSIEEMNAAIADGWSARQ